MICKGVRKLIRDIREYASTYYGAAIAPGMISVKIWLSGKGKPDNFVVFEGDDRIYYRHPVDDANCEGRDVTTDEMRELLKPYRHLNLKAEIYIWYSRP